MSRYIIECPDKEKIDVDKYKGGFALGVLVCELVMCGECENWQTDWNPEEGVNDYHFCPMVDRSTFGDWYCADAERKDE